ncbi:hypothetical protein [Candidatus Spongiihabitans sp.]|uniref:hypothetical protein n=1 Tax=Candidatus Spongiihabitans sp. TaxID=3101308 RepID=UPI003C798928
MTYPDDSIQACVDKDWWISKDNNSLCRGTLVFAFVPHVDQTPYTLEPVGRKNPTQHSSAELQVKPLNIQSSRPLPSLPVAAMPLYHGELWAAYRAKKRPCIVLSDESPLIDKNLIRGAPKRNTAPTVLVAPYYGVGRNNRRSGYNPAFIERVRHCEYPQFFWDQLPIDGPKESLLRLDHLQPIGTHYQSYQSSSFKLNNTAMEVLDEMLQWLIYGGVHEDSLIALYRKEIEDSFG